MTDQFTHIADVKVGAVKGNSRIYPSYAYESLHLDKTTAESVLTIPITISLRVE